MNECASQDLTWWRDAQALQHRPALWIFAHATLGIAVTARVHFKALTRPCCHSTGDIFIKGR
jgi:hypothetical protein